MSRYGLLGMALVVASFVLLLVLVAPRPGAMDSARRMAHLGNAIEMYAVRHDGRLPADLAALAEEDLLPADFVRPHAKRLRYLAAGRARDTLPAHGIVALEDPADIAGSILVTVLLSDGAVLSIPADVVRDAAARDQAGDAPLPRVESSSDGQLIVVMAAAQ